MKDRFGYDSSKAKGTQFWKLPHVGRRMFFRHVASAMTGYFLLPTRPMENVAKAAGTPIGTAKNCIFILLTGAPSHVDTFDLKEGSWTPSYFNPTSYGDLRFPQGLMPNLANQLDSVALRALGACLGHGSWHRADLGADRKKSRSPGCRRSPRISARWLRWSWAEIQRTGRCQHSFP